jgi:hypothetical protein
MRNCLIIYVITELSEIRFKSESRLRASRPGMCMFIKVQDSTHRLHAEYLMGRPAQNVQSKCEIAKGKQFRDSRLLRVQRMKILRMQLT